ncbi:MAG: hypothetical protein V7640_3438 [Betaproteobacteria bacterium]
MNVGRICFAFFVTAGLLVSAALVRRLRSDYDN